VSFIVGTNYYYSTLLQFLIPIRMDLIQMASTMDTIKKKQSMPAFLRYIDTLDLNKVYNDPTDPTFNVTILDYVIAAYGDSNQFAVDMQIELIKRGAKKLSDLVRNTPGLPLHPMANKRTLPNGIASLPRRTVKLRKRKSRKSRSRKN
jgi:hypothetical protein